MTTTAMTPAKGPMAAARAIYAAAAKMMAKLDWLALLGARLLVARVFLLSGLTKWNGLTIRDDTFYLFADEYFARYALPTPLINTFAVLSSVAEIALPVLLIAGLFTRAAALGLLVFLAPLLALVAVAIKVDSTGPVLYRQRRVGLDGREFDIFKFRSMREDAERDGARWAAENDDRITRVGRLIRRTRIDEIPQALNILRGEMSFVGPRPERPEFVRLLEKEIPHYHDRHVVKPGITGWAQVKHSYTASVEGAREKLRYDLFYVRRYSPLLDLMIVIMTVRVALLGIGSR